MDSERVILVKGDHSEWFDQAIFVVKKNIPRTRVPLDFVEEAERIINGYLTKSKKPAQPAQTSQKTQPAPQIKVAVGRRNRALNAVTLAGVMILTVLLWFAFKG